MQDIMDRFSKGPNPFGRGMDDDQVDLRGIRRALPPFRKGDGYPAPDITPGPDGRGNGGTIDDIKDRFSRGPNPFRRGDDQVDLRNEGFMPGIIDDMPPPFLRGNGKPVRGPRPPKRDITGERQVTPIRGPEQVPYGGRIGSKPGTMHTMDFKDGDGDGVDDRNQRRAGGKDIVARRREKSLLRRKAEKAEKGATRIRGEREQAQKKIKRTKRSEKQVKKAQALSEKYKTGIKKQMRRRRKQRNQE